ncbi:MAG TPA: CBS domain-containing protein [Candidatus Binataceae bacterium]|jgi:CBS domain-containing protein|nr:CBS domain-containing protein [Candidatus Binataceae bacterium]
MTREVVTLREEMSVASALALSAERGVKRIPVVDADGRLVGIIGRTELMRALLGTDGASDESLERTGAG